MLLSLFTDFEASFHYHLDFWWQKKMRKYNFIAVVHLFKKKLTATLESLQILFCCFLSTFSFAGITVFLLINYKDFCIFFGNFFFSWHFHTLITSPIFNVPYPLFFGSCHALLYWSLSLNKIKKKCLGLTAVIPHQSPVIIKKVFFIRHLGLTEAWMH